MSYSEFVKLVAIVGIDKMDKFVQQYKQSQAKQRENPKVVQKKQQVVDEYDEFLRELDRLQDFAPIRWQLGGPTWAVVGNDILPQDKKKPGVQ